MKTLLSRSSSFFFMITLARSFSKSRCFLITFCSAFAGTAAGRPRAKPARDRERQNTHLFFSFQNASVLLFESSNNAAAPGHVPDFASRCAAEHVFSLFYLQSMYLPGLVSVSAIHNSTVAATAAALRMTNPYRCPTR